MTSDHCPFDMTAPQLAKHDSHAYCENNIEYIDPDASLDPNITYGTETMSDEDAYWLKRSRLENIKNGINIGLHPEDSNYIPAPKIFPDITNYRHKILAKSFNADPTAWVEGCQKWELASRNPQNPTISKLPIQTPHAVLIKYMTLYCSVMNDTIEKKLRPECVSEDIFESHYNKSIPIALTILFIISQLTICYNQWLMLLSIIIAIMAYLYFKRIFNYKISDINYKHAQSIIAKKLSMDIDDYRKQENLISMNLPARSINTAWQLFINNEKKQKYEECKKLFLISVTTSILVDIILILTNHIVIPCINIVIIGMFAKKIIKLFKPKHINQSEIDDAYIIIDRQERKCI